MRIARKITMSLELGILVLVVIYAWAEISNNSKAIRADVRSDLLAVARESAAMLATLEPATARDALVRSFDPQTPVQVHWLDGEPPEAPGLAPDAMHVVETDSRMTVYRAFFDPHGQRAVLEVSRSTDDIDRLIRYDLIRSIILIAVIIVAGTLYSISIGSRIVARPMRALIERFRKVGAGDLTSGATPPSDDEFGVLAKELDEMIRQLSQSRESLLSEHKARLETVEQLQHAERLTTVGKLASGIAHELGTPLNVISGYARLIANGQETGEAAADAARIIDEQTHRITKIVRQLLDFARRGRPKLAMVDLRSTVGRALNLAAVLAKKANVRLDYQEPDAAMLADIDDGRMQQVIVNLVHNAIQASPSGSAVEVEMTHAPAQRPGTSATTDAVRICIADRGAGIPAEDVHRVFEPFFTTKAVGEGTGLGLSVSHGILQEHGGWIEVASEVGKGSRFSVYLPAHAEAAA